MKFFPKVRQAAKKMFDEFVENYAENYDEQDIFVHHEWHMALDYDANITFESIKIELITEYGFDETFKLVRDYAYDGDSNLVELPKDGLISYLYYFLMKHVVETEFGDVEEAVRRKGTNSDF